MTFDRTKSESELLHLVQSRAQHPGEITPQTDLITSGLMDSLLLVDLIFHLEETYGIRFESEHIDPANFHSIVAIVDLVAERLQATAK